MPCQMCYVFLYWRDSWNDGPPLHQIHYSILLQLFLHCGLKCGCSEYPPLSHFTSAQCLLFLPPKMQTPSVCNKGSQFSYDICSMNSVNLHQQQPAVTHKDSTITFKEVQHHSVILDMDKLQANTILEHKPKPGIITKFLWLLWLNNLK